MAVSLGTWLRRQGIDTPFAALTELTGEAAVFVVDADRTILHWNNAAERLFGFRKEEVLGGSCLQGFRCPACLVGCGVAEHGTLKDARVEAYHLDGELLTFTRSAQAFFDADGRFSGAVEVLTPAPDRASPAAAHGGGVETFQGMVTRAPLMLRAFQTIRNVAETEATILVRGESGTGKELVARAIHLESRRRSRPFVAVNCASFTPSLLESELFGHIRGAFTGATGDREGIFAQADGGTLFLDEVAELPLELQSKLLRVLQERTFTPVGSARAVKVDVRIVAATHKALREEVKAGRFREDLMFRLRVVPVFLPPLRERPEDIELLLETFVSEANARGPRRVAAIDAETRRRLLAWPWPGNVRELQNVVEYMFAVGRAPVITPDCLPPEFGEVVLPDLPFAPAPDTRRAEEAPASAAAIAVALQRAGGHVGRAAALLGVSRPTFWRWRKRLTPRS